MTIPRVVASRAKHSSDKPAIVDLSVDHRVNYEQLNNLMLEAAAAYISAGIKKGDRVAIWAPNSLNWIVACLGLQAAGAVLVPLNTRFKGSEAQFILNKSRARILVTVNSFLGVSYPDMLSGLNLPHLEQIVTLDSVECRTNAWAEFLASSSQKDKEQVKQRLDELSGDDISDIMFTSGTTGEPKGVITTHGQNVQTYQQWANCVGLCATDRYLIIWPFFHCSGYKSGWLASFIMGSTVYPEAVLDIESLRTTLESEKITVMPGPPTLFQTLLADPDIEDKKLPIRLAVTGASSVPPSLIEAMRTELGIESVLAGYGLTETCGTVTMTDRNDAPELVVRSCGRPIEGVEVRCVDSKGNEVSRGETGEVVVRGFNVMKGYLDEAEETAATIDKDGWLHTGDLAVMDEAGYLTITDRLKDIFISGGFNCYPAEIEKILLTNDNIAQVAVVGVPDKRQGEVGKAYVVLKPNKTLTNDELYAQCRKIMANYKVPRYFEFIEELPLNATGKVQKFKL